MSFQEFVDISDIAIVKCVYLPIARDYIILQTLMIPMGALCYLHVRQSLNARY